MLLGTAIACGLALLLATLGAAAGAASGEVGVRQTDTTQHAYEGMAAAPAVAPSIRRNWASRLPLVPVLV